ncbi:MAG: hypothetical protein MAGBODY4_01496 [Candidatus Marinimicrobia bacterium]|nr:hypothetical protein [Candidatus Neomarinimicrobiota bacterium]
MKTAIKRIFILSGVVFFLASTIEAQTGRQTRYEPGDWVTIANFHYVTSFTEGNRFVYVGTTNGVLRFNQLSQEWEYPYTVSSGLSNGYVLNLYWNESASELWVLTRGGIDVISTVTDRWENISDAEQYLQTANRRLRIRDSGNSLYITNNGRNPFRVNKFTHYVDPVNSIPDNVTKANPEQKIPGNIPQYFLDGQWIINRNNNTLQDEYFREYRFTVQYTDTQKQIWIGTWGAGFIKADAVTETGRVYRFGPLGTEVGAIFKDADRFWIGSAQSQFKGPSSIQGVPGISYWELADNNRWTHFRQRDEYSIDNATIYNIDGDSLGVWFGTERGLLHYSTENNRWENIKSSAVSSHQIYDVLVQDSLVWVAARSGLYRLSNPRGTVSKHFEILEERVIGVYALARVGDKIFAGTDYGLLQLDIPTMELTFYDDEGKSAPPEEFRELRIYTLTGNDQAVYYANDFGIFEQNLRKQTVRELPKVGLYARSIPRKVEFGAYGLWVGFDDGVGQYNPSTREWEFFTREDGLASNLVYDIVPNSDYIWFATRQGVTRFRPTKLRVR